MLPVIPSEGAFTVFLKLVLQYVVPVLPSEGAFAVFLELILGVSRVCATLGRC